MVLPSGLVQRTAATGVPAIDLGGTKNQREFQRHIAHSAFHEEKTEFDSVLGEQTGPRRGYGGDEPPTQLATSFDGKTPAKEVTSRDVWKAINAPLQSRPGRRSAELYGMVLYQFAVGANPRYESDAPDKPRTHIFIWDVTRAMNVEVPHFAGARELNASQTCQWLRFEGPARGWLRVDPTRALQAANDGMPVLAMPKDVKIDLLALVRPGEMGPNKRPLLSGVGLQRGYDLPAEEIFGASVVEFFYHH